MLNIGEIAWMARVMWSGSRLSLPRPGRRLPLSLSSDTDGLAKAGMAQPDTDLDAAARAVLNALPTPSLILGADGTILWTNAASTL